MDKTNLGDRMKQYESIPKNFLMRRQPVIIRLDMKAGHTFTKGFKKPFDGVFMKSMQDTMKYLCENIQGCVLGYAQSDEITLVLCDYQTITTDAWFGYNVQKITSISASMATLAFNNFYCDNVMAWSNEEYSDMDATCRYFSKNQYEIYKNKMHKALFDSRTFTVPINEVNNCLVWRQQDATRNSIQSLAQSLYSHKEIERIDCKRLQDKMFTEKGINWNNLSTTKKRGSCCYKTVIQNPNVDPKDGAYSRKKWIIDNEIPIFSQDKDYVNSRIIFKD